MILTITDRNDWIVTPNIQDENGISVDFSRADQYSFQVYTPLTSEENRITLDKTRYTDGKLWINSSELQKLAPGDLYLDTILSLPKEEMDDGTYDTRFHTFLDAVLVKEVEAEQLQIISEMEARVENLERSQQAQDSTLVSLEEDLSEADTKATQNSAKIGQVEQKVNINTEAIDALQLADADQNQRISSQAQGLADLEELVAAKADKSDVYTKARVNELLDAKMPLTDLSVYATKAQLQNMGAEVDGVRQDVSTANAVIANQTRRINELATTYDAISDDISDVSTSVRNTKTRLDALQSSVEGLSIPTKVSQLENDRHFISEIPSEYVTESELLDKHYLTQHQDLSAYATSAELNSLRARVNGLNVPTKTSDLTNDSGFIQTVKLNEYARNENVYTRDEIDNKLTAIPKFAIRAVDQLPDTDISSTTIYLLRGDASVGNTYSEWVYVNGAWEKFGDNVKLDLSEYAKLTQIPTRLSQLTNDIGAGGNADLSQYVTLTDLATNYASKNWVNNKGFMSEESLTSILNTRLAAYALKVDISIPTKVSDLQNDRNYISVIPDNYVTREWLGENRYATQAWVTNQGYLTSHQSLSAYAKKTDLPYVPTKVSELVNDRGYLTQANISQDYITPAQLTEILSNKNYVTATQLEEKGYIVEIPSGFASLSDIPTALSQLDNDVNFVTRAQLSSLSGYDDTSIWAQVNKNKNDLSVMKSAGYLSEEEINDKLAAYQRIAQMPTFKTINGQEITGSGNIVIKGSGIDESVLDGYVTNTTFNANKRLVDSSFQALEGRIGTVETTTNSIKTQYAKRSDIATINGLDILNGGQNIVIKAQGAVTAEDVSTMLQSYVSHSSLTNTLNSYALKNNIPSKLSDLVNDRGFITADDISAGTVVTKTSQLTNDSGFITSADIPRIPSRLSDLVNDVSYVTPGMFKTINGQSIIGAGDLLVSGEGGGSIDLTDYATKDWANDTFQAKGNYLTDHQSLKTINGQSLVGTGNIVISGGSGGSVDLTGYATETWVKNQYYLTEHQSLAGYATQQWVNAQGFAKDTSAFATKSWVQDQGYLTQHQSLSGYATVGSVNEVAGDLATNYYTKTQIDGKIANPVDMTNYVTKGELSGFVTNGDFENAIHDLSTAISGIDTSSFATQAWVTNQGYLTQHQSLSNYYTKSEVDSKIPTVPNMSNYYTKSDIDALVPKVRVLTQSQYNQLQSLEPNTFYVISE